MVKNLTTKTEGQLGHTIRYRHMFLVTGQNPVRASEEYCTITGFFTVRPPVLMTETQEDEYYFTQQLVKRARQDTSLISHRHTSPQIIQITMFRNVAEI